MAPAGVCIMVIRNARSYRTRDLTRPSPKFRVRVGVRVSLGLKVRIIVRVRISVMVRVSTTQTFKYNH